MRKGKYILMLCQLLLLPAFVHVAISQNIRVDLEKMYHAYNNLQRYSADVQVEVFSGRNAKDPVMSSTYIIRKDMGKMRYEMDNIITLHNERYMVQVNTDERRIRYSELSKTGNPAATFSQTIPNIDSLVRACDSVAFVGRTGHTKHYVLLSSRQAITEMHFFLHDETHLIERLIYYYNPVIYPENNKVSVYYANSSVDPVFAKNEFSEARYIIRNGQALVPASGYENFQIVKPAANE